MRSDGTAVLMELPHAYGHGGSMHFPANNAVPMQRMGAPTSPAASPATPHAVNGTGSQSRSADQALNHVQQCAITHPGSITCTAAAVQLDPEAGTVEVSLKATVRRTEQCSVSTLVSLLRRWEAGEWAGEVWAGGAAGVAGSGRRR